MALSRGEQLIKRFNVLKDKQATWRPVWQDLADYILPTRKNIVTKRTPGASQTDKLVDSTAPDSAIKLAAFIAGSLTNMAIRWFSLKMRSEELNNDKETSVWLDSCAEEIYLALRQSNFNTESQELYTDLAVFGTGCMLIEEKEADGKEFGGYRFRTEAIGTYVIGENADGLVDTLMRMVSMPVSAAAQRFGKEKLSEASRKLLEKNPDASIDIVHAIVPRHTAPGKLKKNKPWASYYIEYEKKNILDEGGYDENPAVVVRWSKTAGEDYGRGPGHIALPDIKTLNKADELTLRGWAKIIAPPLKAREDGVLGRVRTQPESINIVRDMDALQPMEQGGKWDVNAALTTDRRASIRRMFFADQLQLPDKTIITATEVDRRIELMQQILGPTMGRLEYEYLNPLISRCFKLLLRAGVLPPPPQKVIEFTQQRQVEIDVEYEGPLARAQRGGELQALNRLMQGVAPIIQLNPNSQILDNLDEDAVFRFLLKVTGAHKTFLRSEDATADIREQRGQALQAEQAGNTANLAADTAQKAMQAEATLSEINQPTSPYGDPTQTQAA